MYDFSIFENCLREKKNIIFIMINDNYHYKTNNIYEDKTENKKLQIAYNRDYEIQIDGLLKEIDNVLSTFNEGINLVLFYEYFFSRNPISYKAKEELILKLKMFLKNIKILYFLPQFFIY